LIIGGYIYVGYNKLNKRLDLLEKEISSVRSDNICKLPNKQTLSGNNNIESTKELEDLAESLSNEEFDLEEQCREQFINSNQQINNEINSNSTSESQSIETTRNEVEQLEDQLRNVENLLDNGDNTSEGVLNYELLDQKTTGRIDSILDDSDKYNSLVTQDNSELNELIKRESGNSPNLELNSNNIAENISEDNMRSLEQIETSNKSIEEAKQIIEKDSQESFHELNDDISDKQQIQESLIRNTYNLKKVKELKAICQEHGLSQTGNKNALIDRIIDEGVINQLENSSNSVELTENLTQ